MRKATKLYILLGVLIVVCAAAFAVSRYEQKKENIKNSGEVILEIPTDSVTAVSWTNENGTFSFTKDEGWTYDDDEAFPVDESKINDILAQFESFAAAFSIEDVDDYSQYGLDEPVCTISITAGESSYTIELGDISKMDEERYVSIGDGKAYLVEHDPLDEYDAVLSDMILDDTIPEFDTVEQITFSGNENYVITRDEDEKSICEDDIYFTDGKPLDTDNVDSYVSRIKNLSLTDYASYNVSDEELKIFGLDDPDITVELSYSKNDDEGNVEETGSFEVHFSQNRDELAAYEEALENDEDELPSVTCYARLGDSQIVYEISSTTSYSDLTDVSYDTLRHQTLFTGDLSTVTSIDITLDGESYTFTYNPPEDSDDDTEDEDSEGTWTYQDEEFAIGDFKSALTAVTATDFTSEKPTDIEEISVTLHLDNEDFPTFKLELYRYDGTNCIAVVDGESVAFVSRNETVNLVEAVNEVTLGK